jgi:hypothetical protein
VEVIITFADAEINSKRKSPDKKKDLIDVTNILTLFLEFLRILLLIDFFTIEFVCNFNQPFMAYVKTLE